MVNQKREIPKLEVKKYGNSLCFVIPKYFADLFKIKIGDLYKLELDYIDDKNQSSAISKYKLQNNDLLIDDVDSRAPVRDPEQPLL